MTNDFATVIEEDAPIQDTSNVNLAPILDYLKQDGPYMDTGYNFLHDKVNIDLDKLQGILDKLSMAELKALRKHLFFRSQEQTNYWAEVLNKMDSVHSAQVGFWCNSAQLLYNVGRYVVVKQRVGKNKLGVPAELHITVQPFNDVFPNTQEAKDGADKAIEVANLVQGAVSTDCSYSKTLEDMLAKAIEDLYVKAGSCQREYIDKHAEQVKKERSADLPF